MNGYELSRNWFNWAFDNPELVKPIHAAIFFFACEHQNRLGGKNKFGLPSQMTMEAIGVKKHQTYMKALNELEEWDFITFIERSKNQYSSNIISINAPTKSGKARGKALDKATIKHGIKQGQSKGLSTVDIDKPINHITNKPENQEKDLSPFELIQKEKPSELESWKMQNLKSVHDFNSLVDSFNDSALLEVMSESNLLKLQSNMLIIRFRKYARSWIANQKGNSVPKNVSNDGLKVGDIVKGMKIIFFTEDGRPVFEGNTKRATKIL